MSGKSQVYNDVREKYENFSSDEDLVSFFREVLEREDGLDKEMDMELDNEDQYS